MVAAQWKVRPPLDGPRAGVWLGAGGAETDGVWLGSLAEVVSGRQPAVWLSTKKEQVVAVVGERGSGKLFSLGVIAEGLASGTDSALGRQENPRAVLLFDPLDVYWTTRYAVAPSDNAEVQRHYQLAQSAGLPKLTFDVRAWVPGEASRRDADPDWFETLRLPVPAMGLEEWELLLDTNAMSEPMGQALADSLALVRSSGYHRRGEEIAAKSEFGLADMLDAVRADELAANYHSE